MDDNNKKAELEKRISKSLQHAIENEDESKGFYKDLVYTEVDEEYIDKLATAIFKQRMETELLKKEGHTKEEK